MYSNSQLGLIKPSKCHEGAINWLKFGFKVIPVVSGSKRTALTWDPWLADLSINTINDYWIRNSNAELGAITGDDVIVFDADSPESITALLKIETDFSVKPNFIVQTNKGLHHYFKRGEGAFARSDSHDTKQHPNRIDIKTGRALIVLPPSTGKHVAVCEAETVADLVELGQDVIDAIFKHNGRETPRLHVHVPTSISTDLSQLQALVEKLDPDMGYDDWVHVGMALYNETGGSDEGLALFDSWSSQGSKYNGNRELQTKWRSFKLGTITIASLYKMAGEVEPCNPFEKHSLQGKSGMVEAFTVNAKPILGDIALAGQLTVIYAEFNSGKTLITLHLLGKSISEGNIDPKKVFYLNMDDTSNGLLEKIHLADEYGFHMLSEGFAGFTASNFMVNIQEIVKNNQAKGVIIILDTLKKFVDLMNKNESSEFAQGMREFALKGGSLIALAHDNKTKVNGKSQYGGTNDIMSDFDSGYIIDKISSDNGTNIVEFTKKKGRGCNVSNVSYSYSNESTLSYCQILSSVQVVDPTQLESFKRVEQQKADVDIVESVKGLITKGIDTKMSLAKTVAQDVQVSQKVAIGIIEKYEGKLHYWQYKTGPKGAKIYSLM